MNRSIRVSLGMAAGLLAAACTDQSRSTSFPTSPSAHIVTSADACTSQLANTIATEQKALWSGTVLKSLQDKFKDVKQACGTAAGERLALEYASLVIANKTTTASSSVRAQALSHHVSHVTGYAAINGHAPADVPFQSWLPGGGIKVIDGSSGGTLITESYVAAGLTVRPGTTPAGPFLFTIYRDPTQTCFTTNLQKPTPYCYIFGAYNYLPPPGFNPTVQVFVCQEETIQVPGKLVNLLHQDTHGTQDVLPRGPLGNETYPILCTHGDPPTLATGPLGTLERMVASAYDFVAPKPLYAINTPPTGESSFDAGMSPIGGVNRLTFLDDFADEAVSNPPVSPLFGQNWVVTESGAGNIRVQSSWNNTFDKSVLLNQAQGCSNDCGALELSGALYQSSATVFASSGVYLVSWQSGQDRPTINHADFVLRGSGTPGLEIGRLTYRTTSTGASVLEFDGTAVGTWTVHTAQTFTMQVDLNTHTVTMTIDGVNVGTKPFVAAATDFNRLAWENGFVDSGKTAFDNPSVVRCVDGPTGPICNP